MITFKVLFCFLGSGGGMPDMPHNFCLKLLRGFKALVSPVNISLGISVVILDGASIVQMLKGVGGRTVQ